MNVEEFREYCLSLKGVEEKMPFVNVADRYSRDVLCFYVGDKWFCFVNVEVFDFCCIKCDPVESGELQARYVGVRPGWHMNKRHWQVSEGKCYTMQSDGDRNYIVLCNGNTIGGFSLSDGYIAGLVRYKKEFYALRICASEYTDKDTKFEEAVYKWSIGKIDFKNNAFVEIFNASESRSDSQIPDAYDVCVYKDKVILYYQEKIHIWNMTGKKNKAVINAPHLPQGDSDYTVYDNKIFYGIHDENKINLYYFDMQNNMEKKFYSYVSKNAVKNCSVSVKFDDENLYVSNCMVNRQDGTKKQIFNKIGRAHV